MGGSAQYTGHIIQFVQTFHLSNVHQMRLDQLAGRGVSPLGDATDGPTHVG